MTWYHESEPEQDERNIYTEEGSGDNRKITHIQTEWPNMVHRLNLVGVTCAQRRAYKTRENKDKSSVLQ